VASAIRLFLTPGSSVEHALTFWSVVLLFAIGVVSGVLAGLLGVGGGVVMVPAMMILLGLPPVIAKGTSVAVIIPTAITGTIRNRSNKNVNLQAAAMVGCTGIVSAVAGGYLSDVISDSCPTSSLVHCLRLLHFGSLSKRFDSPKLSRFRGERTT